MLIYCQPDRVFVVRSPNRMRVQFNLLARQNETTKQQGSRWWASRRRSKISLNEFQDLFIHARQTPGVIVFETHS